MQRPRAVNSQPKLNKAEMNLILKNCLKGKYSFQPNILRKQDLTLNNFSLLITVFARIKPNLRLSDFIEKGPNKGILVPL